MRSPLLVILSLLILASGFFVYMKVSNHGSQVGTVLQGDPPPPESGEKIKYTNLKSRITASTFTPLKNGTIALTEPVAEFFMDNGQVMKVTGVTGEVDMPPSSKKGTAGPFSRGGPRKGRIYQVTIELFNMYPDSKPDVADEVITTNNIAFDTVDRELKTDAFDDKGELVTAENVPVHMRSTSRTRGYDFDGKGLRLRWNDTDGRLDLLEVAHGDWLEVKDTSSSSSVFGGDGHPVKPPATLPTTTVALTDPGSGAPAASTPPAAPRAIPAKKGETPGTRAKKKASPPVPFVATFYQDVRIAQGVDVLLTADQMDVDFISRQAGETSAPKTQPASQPTTKIAVAATQATTTQPATRPAPQPVLIKWTGQLHMAPAVGFRPKVTAGDAILTLSSISHPVVVRRTVAGQREGDIVTAARLVYHTSDGRVELSNSDVVPQVVIDKLVNGKIDETTKMTTGKLEYLSDRAGKKFARLSGPGSALMPVESNGAKAGDAGHRAESMMKADWTQGAEVFFAEKGQDQMSVKQVDLAGAVHVKHPQLLMNSQALSLYFKPAPPTTRPAGIVALPSTRPATTRAVRPNDKPQQELEKIIAKDAVHCELAAQNGRKQTIDCNELEMHTARSPDGKFFARTINTRGNVHATDGEQDIRAGIVDLTLKPATPVVQKPGATTRPAVAVAQTMPTSRPAKESSDTTAVELEKMVAKDHVHVVNDKDGSDATGAELTITTDGSESHIRLTGAANRPAGDVEAYATVTDAKKNVIAGPLITAEPKQGIAHVIGPGRMHMLQEQADGKPSRPMDVTWITGADMSGPADRVDVLGAVVVHTVDSDGTINDVTGDRVQIDLMKKAAPATRPATHPTTRPATRPATLATTQPATRPAKQSAMADSMRMDIMKDKEVRTITIFGKGDVPARTLSTLTAKDGKILREVLLIAPEKIVYHMADANGQAARTLVVPSAGQMLVGDHRPPEKVKAGKPKKEDDSLANRGTTAFTWTKNLTYSEKWHEAVINGDVFVKHRPDEKGATELIVEHADQVTATFDTVKPVTTRPATTRAVTTLPATTRAATTMPATTTASTAPASRPARAGEPGDSLQLKHLVADGHVRIHRGDADLIADQVDYDPITHWMIARGTETRLVRYTDVDPKKSMTAVQLEWNTETGNFKMSDPKK